ncbi:MAG: 50S ribosomal protein L31 [Caldilinea sp.]|nr:50S ribosomal protein L31 [Caldilinea sp.]
MKADIHPKYYPNARAVCSCGATWTTGSTLPEIRTDVCSTCHPYYTGEQRIVDTAGQVERFMKRLERRQSESARRELVYSVGSTRCTPCRADRQTAVENKHSTTPCITHPPAAGWN